MNKEQNEKLLNEIEGGKITNVDKAFEYLRENGIVVEEVEYANEQKEAIEG